MNTVGKLLVILNFLFAVVVGAFLVVDFVARSNWKAAHDELYKKVIVISADREQHADDANRLRGQVKEQIDQLEKLKGDIADVETRAKVEASAAELKLKEAQGAAGGTSLTLQKALTDIERLKVSEADLKKIIKEREGSILALQDDVKKYRTEAIAKDLLASQVQERNTELLKQVQDLSLEIARKGALGGSGSPSVRLANQPNPPSTMVKGKVERVDKTDGTLVTISLGTDQGVNTDNTMEVFRTSPQAKYLGMLRILNAGPTRSVGRLIVPAGASRPQLAEGDQVWSRLK